jgi:hypothetical protein
MDEHKKLQYEMYYECHMAISKGKITKRHKEFWETFVSYFESDLYEVKCSQNIKIYDS